MRAGRAAVDSAARALFPHACLVCGAEGDLLCGAHHGHVGRSFGGVFCCPGCETVTSGGMRCGGCPPGSVIAHAALGPYARSVAGALLRAWKYEGIAEAESALLDAVREAIAEDPRYRAFIGGAVLVPVPCDALRRAVRGFDQAVVLATAIAEAAGGVPMRQALFRSAHRKPQAGLDDDAARRRNARRAFRVWEDDVPEDVVLIDDVYTSGATAEACAAALMEAGAQRVRVLTVMRG